MKLITFSDHIFLTNILHCLIMLRSLNIYSLEKIKIYLIIFKNEKYTKRIINRLNLQLVLLMVLLGILQRLGNLQLLGILLVLLGIHLLLVVLLQFEHKPSTLLGGRYLQVPLICSCILRFQHFSLLQSIFMFPLQVLQVISFLQHWIYLIIFHLSMCSWLNMQFIPKNS